MKMEVDFVDSRIELYLLMLILLLLKLVDEVFSQIF